MPAPFRGLISAVCLLVCLLSLAAWFYTWSHGNTSKGNWFFAIALFAGLFVLLSRREQDKDD